MRIYQTVCGIHYLNGEIEIIEQDELYGFDSDWYTFGACKTHLAELSMLEFRDIVIEHGVKLKAGELPPEMKVKKKGAHGMGGRKAGTTNGPDPGEPGAACLYCTQVSKNDKSLAQHLRNIHKFKGTSDSYGNECPIDGKEWPSLGRHATYEHKVSGLAELFAEAERLGDPHGIVAIVKKRKPVL